MDRKKKKKKEDKLSLYLKMACVEPCTTQSIFMVLELKKIKKNIEKRFISRSETHFDSIEQIVCGTVNLNISPRIHEASILDLLVYHKELLFITFSK